MVLVVVREVEIGFVKGVLKWKVDKIFLAPHFDAHPSQMKNKKKYFHC